MCACRGPPRQGAGPRSLGYLSARDSIFIHRLAQIMGQVRSSFAAAASWSTRPAFLPVISSILAIALLTSPIPEVCSRVAEAISATTLLTFLHCADDFLQYRPRLVD